MVDRGDEMACILIEKEKGRKGTAETNLLELIGNTGFLLLRFELNSDYLMRCKNLV